MVLKDAYVKYWELESVIEENCKTVQIIVCGPSLKKNMDLIYTTY